MTEQIVVFTLDEQRYGIPLEVVEKVVRMVEITHLPAGPDFIRGVINVQGKIMPVLDLRCRFGLAPRSTELWDQLIIIRCARRSLALMADTACEVRECTEKVKTTAAEILSDLPFLAGVAKLPDGLILLSDPAALLTPGEANSIDELMKSEPT